MCFPDNKFLHFSIVCSVDGVRGFKTDESWFLLTFLLSISLVHLEFCNKQAEEARLLLQHFAGRSPPLNPQVRSFLVLLFTRKTLLWEPDSMELCVATQQGCPSLQCPGTGSSFPSESSLAAAVASVVLPTVCLRRFTFLLHHLSHSL